MRVRFMAGVLCMAWIMTHMGASADAAQFIPLGILPGDRASRAHGISADGAVVVGASSRSLSRPFRWTFASGMQALPTEPGHEDTTARAASADGAVIAGESLGDDGNLSAVHWTAGGPMQFLGGLPESFLNGASGMSANGEVIVGSSYLFSGEQEAVIWTAGGVQGIGDLPGGDVFSHAWATNADGSVVVGIGTTAAGIEAFRWTAPGGMQGLGFNGEPQSTNADGSVIVGTRWYSSPVQGGEAFRWTANDGFEGLGTLAGATTSAAFATDAAGEIVVGEAGVFGPAPRAFLWTRADGMVELQTHLAGLGAAGLEGWTLQRATGVSGNGTHIVGYGRNPDGQTEAWLAVVPEPASWELALLFVTATLAVRRRQLRR